MDEQMGRLRQLPYSDTPIPGRIRDTPTRSYRSCKCCTCRRRRTHQDIPHGDWTNIHHADQAGEYLNYQRYSDRPYQDYSDYEDVSHLDHDDHANQIAADIWTRLGRRHILGGKYGNLTEADTGLQ